LFLSFSSFRFVLKDKSIDYLNIKAQNFSGANVNMPTIKNAKTKAEEEAKKAVIDAKKAGSKVAEESKKAATMAKGAGKKAAEDTKKVAEKVKKKM